MRPAHNAKRNGVGNIISTRSSGMTTGGCVTAGQTAKRCPLRRCYRNPVSHGLEPYEWSNEETAAYEAAIKAIDGAVGAYSTLIAAQERARRSPTRP